VPLNSPKNRKSQDFPISCKKIVSRYPNNNYIFDWKLQTMNSFLVMVAQPEVYFPRWISKNCCHLFTLWPFVGKFSRNIAALILNTSVTSKDLSIHNSRWRPPPPSWCSKNCCHLLNIWPIATKISGNIGTSIWNTSMTSEMQLQKLKKAIVAILKFGKRLSFLHYWNNQYWIIGILRLWYRIGLHTWSRKG